MSLSKRQEYKRLKTSLDRLFVFLHKNYNINYGGCCWLSYCLANNLERLGINYDLILYTDEDYTEKDAYYNIKDRVENEFPTGDETTNHYTLRVRGMGILNKDPGEPFIVVHGIDSEDLKWIYDNGDWNKCYNPKINYEIKNLVDITFRIYEEETREIA